jgi:hypothetical protein
MDVAFFDIAFGLGVALVALGAACGVVAWLWFASVLDAVSE